MYCWLCYKNELSEVRRSVGLFLGSNHICNTTLWKDRSSTLLRRSSLESCQCGCLVEPLLDGFPEGSPWNYGTCKATCLRTSSSALVLYKYRITWYRSKNFISTWKTVIIGVLIYGHDQGPTYLQLYWWGTSVLPGWYYQQINSLLWWKYWIYKFWLRLMHKWEVCGVHKRHTSIHLCNTI